MYATGSATTVANAIAALIAFAVANAGMTQTVNRTERIPIDSLDPLDDYTVFCLTKGTRHWFFRHRVNRLFGFPCSSNAGGDWAAITNRPVSDTELTPIFAPFSSYHLFTEGTVVHMALEMSNGSWTHINFGEVTKYGAFTGGHYLGLTNTPTDISLGPDPSGNSHQYLFGPPVGVNVLAGLKPSRIYLPYNGKQYASFGGTILTEDLDYSNALAIAWTPGANDRVLRDQPNAANGRALAPRIEMYIADNAPAGSGLWRSLGYLPNIRPINIEGFNAKDVVNTDWMVFPTQAKNAFLIDTYANSYYRGWAVQK